MHKRGKLLILLTTIIGLAFLTTACTSPKADQPLDRVTVQLKWVHQAQFAGFYLAQEKGYYADENLAVTLLEGSPEIDVTDQVVAGAADFGVDTPENLLVHRGNKGQPVVAIAAIYRRNPLVFVTRAGSGIERPEDFLGRTAALAADGQLQFEALLKHLDLDVEQVEFAPYAYDYSSFLSGQVDITYVYATGGLIRLRQAGHELNLIWPGDYGLHLYADTLITNERLMAEQPELVTRFLRATLRGWQDAIEDVDKAVAVAIKYAREADVEIQTQMMEASLPLIHTGRDQIGWMRPEVWQGMEDILLEQGMLEQPLDINQVYAMEFLQQVYRGVSQ